MAAAPSRPRPRVLPPNPNGASQAVAGDCFGSQRSDRLYCLPAVINIGVQKAGTGELQTWLGSHPGVCVHGGEVHFFDGLRFPCHNDRQRAALRLRYARFLWKRKQLDAASLGHRVTFEKTPAYFDLADPRLVACTVPDAKLLLMLRMPVARAVSAYRMCQDELKAKWCSRPIDDLITDALRDGAPPRVSPTAKAPVRRMLMMGQYATHLNRWLEHYPPTQLQALWVEQFKANPFSCMSAILDFLGLPPFDYRRLATRNAAGLWVVGKSKSNSVQGVAGGGSHGDGRRTRKAHLSPATNHTLHRFYEPSQQRLRSVFLQWNLSLLSSPGPPL